MSGAPLARPWASGLLIAYLLFGVAWPAAAQQTEEEVQPPAEAEPVETPGEEDAAPAEEPAAPEQDPFERPPARRITFDLPLEDESGRVTGSAGALEYQREDYVVASEGVEVNYQGTRIQADWVAMDLTTEKITAEGNVILDEGPQRLAGNTLEYDLPTGTATLFEATGFMAPDIYFRGQEVSKVDEDTYTVKNGMFTSCDDEVPVWSFRAGKARLTVDGYARATNIAMKAKKVPFLYIPYMLYPAKAKRTSGFLVPNVGYSDRQGGEYVGVAYYQTIGDTMDTTFYFDYFGGDYLGGGNEFRYAPTPGTDGIFNAYVVQDELADETRWKVDWQHESEELPGGFRGVVKIRDYSDFQFFRDFERNFNRFSTRSLYSSGYLSGNWGNHSVNLLVDDRETFIRDGVAVNQRQLPELEYRLRQTQLGRLPIYLAVKSSAHYFQINRDQAEDDQYGRFDLFPLITVPLRSWTWLSLSLSGGGRVTWYEASRDQETGAVTGESITRTIPNYGAEIVGPSISRIFNKGAGPFEKFKHVVEPRWTYTFVDEYEDEDLIPLFDEIDRIRDVHLGTFQFINRLVAKPRDPSQGSAREIASFELAQNYSFDADRPLQRSPDGMIEKRESPIAARLRFNPSMDTSIQWQASFNTIFNQITSSAWSGTYRLGRHDFAFTWFTNFNVETGRTTSNQVRFGTGLEFLPNRLRLRASLTLDVGPKGNSERDALQQQRYILQYNAQCYGLRLEFNEFRFSAEPQRDYRLAFTLKNVGTFLDLNGGDSSGGRRSGF